MATPCNRWSAPDLVRSGAWEPEVGCAYKASGRTEVQSCPA